MNHVADQLLDRYVAGSAGAEDVWWAVEGHLERCAACRDRLGDAVRRSDPQTASLVDEVGRRLADEIGRIPPAPVRTGARWRVTPVLLPRLVMTVLVVVSALALDLADAAGRWPSMVLLVAPVAPLLSVAAAWSRGVDPAYELVVCSPRAGLGLVLRRTLGVLAVVIPVLAGAGWLAGQSPAVWLLPCLAFTTGALALGELVGLHRAATGLALTWLVIVAGPSLLAESTPTILGTASLPGWGALAAIAAVVLAIRGRGYTRMPSGR